MWTEPFSLLNHIVRKLVTSFRGLYGTKWDIMVQHVKACALIASMVYRILKMANLCCLW